MWIKCDACVRFVQAEKVSFMSLLDNVVIIMTLTIWALAPGDLSAVFMHWVYNRLSKVKKALL